MLLLPTTKVAAPPTGTKVHTNVSILGRKVAGWFSQQILVPRSLRISALFGACDLLQGEPKGAKEDLYSERICVNTYVGASCLCAVMPLCFSLENQYIYKDFKVCPTMHSANAWSQILLPSASVPCPRLKQRLCHRPKSDVCPFVSLCLCALPSRKTQIAKQVPSPLWASHRLACEEGKTSYKVHFAVMPLCPLSEKQQYIRISP